MIVCPAPLGGDVLERVDDWVRVGVGDFDRLDALEVPRVVQEQLVGNKKRLGGHGTVYLDHACARRPSATPPPQGGECLPEPCSATVLYPDFFAWVERINEVVVESKLRI